MHLLGFEAGIRVTGPRARVLQEYEPRLKTETEMVCWLEAEAGETFEVFWKNTNKAKKSTAGEVWVDGNNSLCMGDAYLGPKDKKEVQVRGPPVSEDTILPLMFQKLNLKPEDDDHPYEAPNIDGLGSIELRILLGHFTEDPVDFKEPMPSLWSKPIYGEDKFEEIYPTASMFIGFAPEKRAPGAGALKKWAMPDGVVGYEMTFTWSYRSRAALQIHYVIPRDPIVAPALSPPPQEPEPERAASVPQVKREQSIDLSHQDQPVAGPSQPSFRGQSPEIIVLSDSDSESPPPRPRRVPTPSPFFA